MRKRRFSWSGTLNEDNGILALPEMSDKCVVDEIIEVKTEDWEEEGEEADDIEASVYSFSDVLFFNNTKRYI